MLVTGSSRGLQSEWIVSNRSTSAGQGVRPLETSAFRPLAISSFRPTRLRVSHVHRDNSEPSRRRTVLIVDDDDEIRHSTRNLLGLSNFNVLLASDGVEALKVLERQHVDALVIDFMMPRLDGVGVVRALGEMPQQQRPPIIIVISLHYQLHARFVGLGVRRILPKPVDVPSLVQEIHAAFQEHSF